MAQKERTTNHKVALAASLLPTGRGKVGGGKQRSGLKFGPAGLDGKGNCGGIGVSESEVQNKSKRPPTMRLSDDAEYNRGRSDIRAAEEEGMLHRGEGTSNDPPRKKALETSASRERKQGFC